MNTAQNQPTCGINGFGRIGRIFLRAAFDRLDVVAINDPAPAEHLAHLLAFDSAHGRWKRSVHVESDTLVIDGRHIKVSHHMHPQNTAWGDLDCVLESAGVFKNIQDVRGHLASGPRRVVYAAPLEGADATVVYGINHNMLSPRHKIISNASCTTNCLAPLAFVLHKKFGIRSGMMNTVHSYTNDQRLLDSSHKDLRRARAAGASMIPTSTGAAKAVGLVLPELQGLLHGVAVRVPTLNVSLLDFAFVSKKVLSVHGINQALQDTASNELKGVLNCEARPLVSCDFMGCSYSSVVDTGLTQCASEHFAKVFAWYDNETGFSCRLVDLIQHCAKL